MNQPLSAFVPRLMRRMPDLAPEVVLGHMDPPRVLRDSAAQRRLAAARRPNEQDDQSDPSAPPNAQRIGLQLRGTGRRRPLRQTPKVDARRLPDLDWNALRCIRCSASHLP
jgi:hypothetical protein